MLFNCLRLKNTPLILSLFLIFVGLFSSIPCFAKPTKPAKEAEELGLEAIEDTSKPFFFTMNKAKWQPGPAHFPPGVEVLVLEGNPNLPTLFTMRLKLPANHEIPAHWQASDQHLTVITGQLMLGLGDKLDKNNKANVISAGSYARIPAKMHHYSWTTEETVLQLTGRGPWQIHFLEGDQLTSEADISSGTSELLHKE